MNEAVRFWASSWVLWTHLPVFQPVLVWLGACGLHPASPGSTWIFPDVIEDLHDDLDG